MTNTVESFSYLNESCHIGWSLDWKEGDSTWFQLGHKSAEMQQHAQSHWCPSCEMSKELLTLSLVLGPAKSASPGSWLETHAESWALQPWPAGSVSDFNKTCQTWIHAEGGEAQAWTVSVGARPLPMRPSALVLSTHSILASSGDLLQFWCPNQLDVNLPQCRPSKGTVEISPSDSCLQLWLTVWA